MNAVHYTSAWLLILCDYCQQWRREGRRVPRAALCRGQYLVREKQKYRILKKKIVKRFTIHTNAVVFTIRINWRSDCEGYRASTHVCPRRQTPSCRHWLSKSNCSFGKTKKNDGEGFGEYTSHEIMAHEQFLVLFNLHVIFALITHADDYRCGVGTGRFSLFRASRRELTWFPRRRQYVSFQAPQWSWPQYYWRMGPALVINRLSGARPIFQLYFVVQVLLRYSCRTKVFLDRCTSLSPPIDWSRGWVKKVAPTAAILKIEKSRYLRFWPILMKFCMMTRISPPELTTTSCSKNQI